MLDKDKALRLARDAYSGSTSYYDANVRDRVERDIRRFQSVFPRGSLQDNESYRKHRSAIFRPKTRATIRKNEAVAAEAFFSTLDVVSISASNEKDKNQAASAEIMQALLQYRLTKTIPWFMICIGAFQDAQVTGICIAHVSWMYNEKRGKDTSAIDLVPIENFRFDPASTWLDPIGTSPYLIRLIPMYVKDVLARMASGRWESYEVSKIVIASSNDDTTRATREENRQDSTQNNTSHNDYTIVWVHQNIVDYEEEDWIYYTLGTSLILSEPVPLSSEYAQGRRPFVIGTTTIETHKNYQKGTSGLGAEIQDEINELTNQRIDAGKFALSRTYFYRRGTNVDLSALRRKVPGMSVGMDDLNDVRLEAPPDIPTSSYQEEDRLNLSYDDVAGVFSGSSVQANRKLSETVGGMNILNSNANQISNYQLKTFTETFVEPVLRLLMINEQEFETDDVIIALCSQRAGLFEKFGIGEVTDAMFSTDLTLSCNVGMGANNPSEKINTLALVFGTINAIMAGGAIEKYGLDSKEVIKEVLSAAGHKDGGKFFSIEKNEDQETNALQQQIQDLTAQLEEKHPKELVAAQVAKIKQETKETAAKSVKELTSAIYAAYQAAQVIKTIPEVSPLADGVLQIAGYVHQNPEGIDPNLPQPQYNGEQDQFAFQQNTSPTSPASPFAGAMSGIETQRSDGVIE